MSIVKSFSVGEGDMFYIWHNSDNFTIIDCCLSDNYKYIIDELLAASKGKNVIRFISTHPDDDHICGLDYLDKIMPIRNFYCVKNEATKSDCTDDFDKYCDLRDNPDKAFYLYEGCSRKWMNKNDKERGSSGINILWPVITNEDYKDVLVQAKEGGSPNNISPIVRYKMTDGATMLWMGDLESDFMENIKDEIEIGAVDILFAPHHGRCTGKVPSEWLEEMNPKIVIIGEAPSKHLDYYPGYNTITQNSAGDIILDCVSRKIHIYVSNEDYSVDYLADENLPNTYGKYIGTLYTN